MQNLRCGRTVTKHGYALPVAYDCPSVMFDVSADLEVKHESYNLRAYLPSIVALIASSWFRILAVLLHE